MDQLAMKRAWDDLLANPIKGRFSKPRIKGITMLFDTGLGLHETEDLIDLASTYIDFVKIGFASSKLYPESVLRRKIMLLKENHIHVYPGGTFLEIAILQNKWREFMQRCADLGFSAIEVSDGTIAYERSLRREVIKFAQSLGLLVLSEVGKKESGCYLPVDHLYECICYDLEYGAFKVIIEGRESGKAVGMFEKDGTLRKTEIEELCEKLGSSDPIIWEAPLKNQQVEFIHMFGINVNVGNINPRDVLSLESLRCGLRSDTLRYTVHPEFSLNKKA
jgi:phosphosulfolactate synthase